MDAVVGDDAMSGHVQLIIPGRTGGLEASPMKSHMAKQVNIQMDRYTDIHVSMCIYTYVYIYMYTHT